MNLFDGRLHGLLIADVADISVGLDALGLVRIKTLVDLLLGEIIEHNGGTSLGERGRDAKTNTVGGAGDPSNLPLQ